LLFIGLFLTFFFLALSCFCGYSSFRVIFLLDMLSLSRIFVMILITIISPIAKLFTRFALLFPFCFGLGCRDLAIVGFLLLAFGFNYLILICGRR